MSDKSVRKTGPRLRLEDLERSDGRITGIGRIDEDVVKTTYRRWAPVYDHTFGRVSTESRRHTVEVINAQPREGARARGRRGNGLGPR